MDFIAAARSRQRDAGPEGQHDIASGDPGVPLQPFSEIPVIRIDDPDAWRSPRLTLKKAGHKVIGTVRFDGS